MRTRIFGALLAAATLTAIAAQEGVRPKSKLQRADFAEIKPGANESEVVRRVGKPILKTEFKRLHERVWDYRYMYGVETYDAEIHFDMSGRVTRIEHYQDRCAMRPVPCR